MPWNLRLRSIIFNSPFEYDVILTFVPAHEGLVYFVYSRTRSPRLSNTFVLIVQLRQKSSVVSGRILFEIGERVL